jgi:membrane protein
VYAEAPWEIPPRAWWSILKRTYGSFFSNHISLLAAAVAFYAFLSFVPLLAAVVMTYGLLADPGIVSEHMRSVAELMPGEAARLINNQMLSIVSSAKSETGTGLAVALILSVYGATRASSAIIEALNIVYREEEARGLLAFYRVSFGITLAAILVVLLGVVTASVLALLEDVVGTQGGVMASMFKLATWLAAGLLTSLMFALIYRFGPHRHKARWQWLTAGSVSATLFWLLATLAMSAYVSTLGSYNETYGSLGAVVIFLLWLFISALVILIGAQINAEAERQTSADTTVGPAAPRGKRGATVANEIVDA